MSRGPSPTVRVLGILRFLRPGLPAAAASALLPCWFHPHSTIPTDTIEHENSQGGFHVRTRTFRCHRGDRAGPGDRGRSGLPGLRSGAGEWGGPGAAGGRETAAGSRRAVFVPALRVPPPPLLLFPLLFLFP